MRVNPRLARSARVLLVILVTAYGALLRLDAISQQYDPVGRPRWLHRLEISRAGPSLLRPSGMQWDPFQRFEHKDGPPSQYRSDPYTYLQYAREMRFFYAAHRREPLFPFATKVWLWLLHDDDSAVSFASGAFSLLAIVLTCLLGTEAFSYGVGLAAAALWAIEFDVITTGTEGWRDDAFTCAVLLVAWLALRFARQRSTRRAIAFGVAAGAACLVRITALSFILPLLAWLLSTGGGTWRPRLRGVAIVALATVVVAGPFLVNCWRVFGDPFYSINVHADVYRATEGQGSETVASAGGYIAGRLRSRPLEAVDTFALGLTQYPFANKWTGFDPWGSRLGRVLALAAIAGLVCFAGFREGRLLIVVLVSSLVPYAMTWRLIADWRFTEHAYPFFLLAACSVPWLIVRAIGELAALKADRGRMRRVALTWGAVTGAAALAWLVLTRVMPPLVFEETVAAAVPATVMAGSRDRAFFGADWPVLTKSGDITTRVASGARATIQMPLPAAADYDVLVRVDPSTKPLGPGMVPQRIQMLLNGRLIGTCDPGSTPDRMGVCRVALPADGVRPGTNRLTLVTDAPSGFRVWYVRVSRSAGAR